ncbi:Cell fate regulator YaaT, PSP1 superfamily (controls sporulation, competence, biofilm development) [Mariniphaga anaerophila]|uniref:Cell fate regulator YaaT, PSP1 superfamily (Controls sporulation, competence, biofilm development) n=1 Tax=Mariniphaga anaerophila TaxID=1484053 RepID=A0A1M5CQ75_9BACT|nr:regulatory iron-sulfur-containing complex subunit RicT [Mariniphaga anaerophila]SHF56915.1 Cell fate regulator YaaT, PSP1 superfamily (controls sporulation, competence, biofilm development) [Mariniphaga anaerophila]
MENLDAIERGICSHTTCGCDKLHVTDWMKDIPEGMNESNIVEVRFKNTRKDYYRNVNQLKLQSGDLVAVEASPGHDIGIVSLTGELVAHQLRKYRATMVNGELRKVYRHARSMDIEKWKEAISLEYETMLQSRQIAASLNLDMKIGDVEYQGDRTKAIFYYIADGRVDFRQLIKVLADTFRIRVEMKQIGARQEAGRIGGIGPCGRELCCSTWICSFVSVTTNAARYQEISLNPQKLAGQCGKLKCCLNFEVDSYLDAQQNFPPHNIPLETEFGTYQFLKSDIFKGIYWYSKIDDAPSALVALPVETVKKIQRMNRSGKKPEKLISEGKENSQNAGDTFLNVVGQEDINRFNKPQNKQRKKKRRKPNRNPNANQAQGRSRNRNPRKQ